MARKTEVVYKSHKSKHIFYVKNLKSKSVLADFISFVNSANRSREIKTMIINFTKLNTSTFPDIIVPIKAISNELSKHHMYNVKIKIPEEKQYLKNIGIDFTHKIRTIGKINSVFDKIWKFESPDEIYILAKAISDEITERFIFEKGVLNGLTYCINEIMDNVFQHSGVKFGYFMAQYHQKRNKIVFAVYDTGKGLQQSFLYTKHSVNTDLEAIRNSIGKEITSNPTHNQGNGLYGLHKIIKNNEGSLNISSRKGMILFDNHGGYSEKEYSIKSITNFGGTTMVNFELNTNKEIIFKNVFDDLTTPSEWFEREIENYLDINDYINIIFNDQKVGFGTRKAGNKIRTKLINIYKNTSNIILLDFKDVNIIASSFGDEVISKLVKSIGVEEYISRFRIINACEDIMVVISNSINQRLNREQIKVFYS